MIPKIETDLSFESKLTVLFNEFHSKFQYMSVVTLSDSKLNLFLNAFGEKKIPKLKNSVENKAKFMKMAAERLRTSRSNFVDYLSHKYLIHDVFELLKEEGSLPKKILVIGYSSEIEKNEYMREFYFLMKDLGLRLDTQSIVVSSIIDPDYFKEIFDIAPISGVREYKLFILN